MEINDFLRSSTGLVVQFLAGLLMVLMGLRILPLNAPAQAPAPTTHQTETASNYEPAPSSYRLAYDPQQGSWIVSPLGGEDQELTSLVPNPGKIQIPSGYLSLEQVRATLLEVMRSSGAWPDDEDRQQLLNQKLDGHPLFRPEDLKRTSRTP